jgi:hypothetical protein
MYLGAAKEREELQVEESRPEVLASARWQNFPISHLSHHGDTCCEVARHWIVAMDFAQLNGGDRMSGPRWLRAKYEWGPSPWPMHWCELVVARGVIAFRAQFIQRYDSDAQAQWRTKWGAEQVSDHWLGDDVIYHEGNAILVGEDEVKLWDSSAGCWLNPRQVKGYGSLAAVRLFADGHWGGGDGLRWGEHRIKPNQWHDFRA